MKYRNIITGEITTPYQYAKRFMLDCYNSSEKGNETAHPKEMTLQEITKYGKELLKDHDDYELIS